jgi:hypothetical protein
VYRRESALRTARQSQQLLLGERYAENWIFRIHTASDGSELI